MVPNMLVLASFFLGATADLEAPKLGGLALRLFNEAEADSTFEEEFLETRRRLADNTQPTSSSVKYTSCTPMWQKKNLWLDRQHISFDYPTSFTDSSKTALRGFRMNTPTDNFRCDSSKNLRYKVTGLPGRKVNVDKVKRTSWNDGADEGLVFLDRHFIDCNPTGTSVPRVLTSFVLETKTGSHKQMRFKYTCGKSSSSAKLDKPAWWGRQNENVHWKTAGGSGWKDAGNHNAGLEYLDRHPVLCPKNEAIAMIRFFGRYRGWGINAGNFQFKIQYRCILVE